MASPGEYKQFFRFRTPVRVDGSGVRPHAAWLARSIELIDFTRWDLIGESTAIGRVVPGVFSYDTLKSLYMDDYEKLIKLVVQIGKNG